MFNEPETARSLRLASPRGRPNKSNVRSVKLRRRELLALKDRPKAVFNEPESARAFTGGVATSDNYWRHSTVTVSLVLGRWVSRMSEVPLYSRNSCEIQRVWREPLQAGTLDI